MKLKLVTFNTFPSKKDSYWQCVLVPSASLLHKNEDFEYDQPAYTAVNFEFLFWCLTLIIEK